ncbi:hypothetical protein HMPREF9176_0416 [Streptococcus downei F0415]|nr:hypothetical protein HMPREF9176_0416 [Streptococcus downei F0415]
MSAVPQSGAKTAGQLLRHQSLKWTGVFTPCLEQMLFHEVENEISNTQ